MSLAVAPGWRRTEFEFEFVPESRGVYPVGFAYLGCGFPFGLWEARRRIEVSGAVDRLAQVLPPRPDPRGRGQRPLARRAGLDEQGGALR